MRVLLSCLLVGFLFVWGMNNIPNMIGYMIVGGIVLMVVKAIKSK